jgi:hypothetical protein
MGDGAALGELERCGLAAARLSLSNMGDGAALGVFARCGATVDRFAMILVSSCEKQKI